jgi:hypothetical protein
MSGVPVEQAMLVLLGLGTALDRRIADGERFLVNRLGSGEGWSNPYRLRRAPR